ncbi:hypothetical protein MSIMFB_00009 [Mycobacterium simulans]|uniref:Uncharacterized protein n=1 Tax=Mycobacterium simulans TaxID=627089 RepID=A0A7Z7N884_9MYCO|nr:hypothetical protein MSIMFB_00009 [Mycobacterium simulans]
MTRVWNRVSAATSAFHDFRMSAEGRPGRMNAFESARGSVGITYKNPTSK